MTDKDTYAPSFRGKSKAEKRAERRAENLESFNEELPDIAIEVEFEDGTTYELEEWEPFAVLMEYEADDLDSFIDEFREKVNRHYSEKTEPSKFGICGWGGSNHDSSKDEYDSHAELAPVVLYPEIRGALMQIGFIAMSDEDEEPVNVVELGADEITYRGEHGNVTFKNTNN